LLYSLAAVPIAGKEPAIMPKTMVVMPTYNEKENLALMVEALLPLPENLYILVVDDNSPDGTGQIADALAAQYPDRVAVLHRQQKAGLGPADGC
jgi:dolichol-phosphate mannosyltransferase